MRQSSLINPVAILWKQAVPIVLLSGGKPNGQPFSVIYLRQRNLANIPNDDILITTRKDIWFKNGDKESNKTGPCAKSSRLFNANWIANTTRGTNDFSHCSTLLYIYDQHVNPTIARWLGVAAGRFNEHYALTELIQWVWRSRIRGGEPIILYLPSNRMRKILKRYLWS